MVETFSGHVSGGKVRLDHRPRWDAAVLGLEGKRVEVTLQRYRENRSLRANAYLWAIYQEIANWSGHERDEIHEAMKAMFLPAREVTLPSGEQVKVLGSTRTLKTDEFAHYVDRVKLWAMEQGIELPEPEAL